MLHAEPGKKSIDRLAIEVLDVVLRLRRSLGRVNQFLPFLPLDASGSSDRRWANRRNNPPDAESYSFWVTSTVSRISPSFEIAFTVIVPPATVTSTKWCSWRQFSMGSTNGTRQG